MTEILFYTGMTPLGAPLFGRDIEMNLIYPLSVNLLMISNILKYRPLTIYPHPRGVPY